MGSNRIGLALVMLTIVAALGCGDDAQQAADADNQIESLRTELATARSAAGEAATKLATVERENVQLRTTVEQENVRLRTANGELAIENANLLRQLSDANDNKVRLLKEKLALSKERFALLPREQQDRLVSYLDRMNAGEDIGLVGLRALANAGMIESDNARLVNAKAATGEGN